MRSTARYTPTQRRQTPARWQLGGLVLLGVLLGVTPAFAGREDPLKGQPAVRHRYELRHNRFTIGPAFSFSLNRNLRHAILFGGRLEYHINDYLAVGADIGYGVGIDTGLEGELAGKKDAAAWKQAHDRFADIQIAGDARLTFTPFTGKIAIFSKLFMAYDLYFFAGFGFGVTKNNTDEQQYDAANEGFRPGMSWGLGMRFFFARWMSMGLELRDLVFADNESGEDITRGLADTELNQSAVLIDGDDKTLTNHFFVGLNFSFYFPTAPVISD